MAKTDLSKSKDHDEVCPTCGTCPTCGAKKQEAAPVYIPYPVPQPYPVLPRPYNPYPWYCTTYSGTTTTTITPSFGTTYSIDMSKVQQTPTVLTTGYSQPIST